MTETSVKTTLNYYLDPAVGGHSSVDLGTAGYYRLKFDEQPVKITDIRGHEQDFDLTKNGFQYYKHTSQEKNFRDENAIKDAYYKEVEQLMKNATGATTVHPYSHFVRRSDRDAIKASVDSKPDAEKVTAVTPARYVHIDESEDGAATVLRDNLPPDATPSLRNCRYAIINVWRPIKPIYKDPLAVCDARSVPDSDLVPITMNLPPKGSMTYAEISAGQSFEVYYAKANPEPRWYFVSAMGPDEVLLIKCFDSKRGGLARRVPHSAFMDPRTVGESTRESIEVRCLVFWEGEER